MTMKVRFSESSSASTNGAVDQDSGDNHSHSHSMLGRSPLRLSLSDHIKTFALLTLSLITLPLSYTLALVLTVPVPSLPSYISWLLLLLPFTPTTNTTTTTTTITTLSDALAHRSLCRAERGFTEYTVLVTGVGMTKGLSLARAFWLCGHRVVAADFDAGRCAVWTPWRRNRNRNRNRNRWTHSRAFDTLYTLKRRPADDEQGAYARTICQIVRAEGVHLWVSCSGVASALEDAMAREALDEMKVNAAAAAAAAVGVVVVDEDEDEDEGARFNKHCCRCASIQFDVATTATLHDKSSFVRHTRELGLPVPETHDVASHSEVLRLLAEAEATSATTSSATRNFILKPVGVDDAHRGDMTLLPLPTADATERHVRNLPIGPGRPWILQQFVRGGREYCTHALVVDGEVRVFAACPSSELLMHYEALGEADDDNDSDALGLWAEMLEFTRRIARGSRREEGPSFTGHLSFDFMVEAEVVPDGDGMERGRMYAIECNPRAHTAVALFAQPGRDMRAMVDAYLSAIDASHTHPSGEGQQRQQQQQQQQQQNSVVRLVVPPAGVTPRYWIGNDLVTLLLLPLWKLVRWDLTLGEFVRGVGELVTHVLFWRDGTFEAWDPWPSVALYHHYWPRAVLASWWKGERWSRLNVSTTKMFAY